MLKGLDENLEIFKEEWEKAEKLSPNVKWAIFPTGEEDIEFQAAKQLMRLFDSLEGFIYFKEDQDPKMIVRALEDILDTYKERAKDQLATAAEKDGYTLHLGN